MSIFGNRKGSLGQTWFKSVKSTQTFHSFSSPPLCLIDMLGTKVPVWRPLVIIFLPLVKQPRHVLDRLSCFLWYGLGFGVHIELMLNKTRVYSWDFIRIPCKNVQVAYQKVYEFASFGRIQTTHNLEILFWVRRKKDRL